MAAVVLLVEDVAAEVAQGGLEHVEDELRTRRSAGLAPPEFRAEELLVLRLREVGEHFGRRAEEDEPPPLVEQEGLVEHLEDLRGRLVDRDEDDLVVRHAPDDLDDMLRVLGGETTRRLVKEVDVGSADHVEADVEALALAAAEDLAVRSPDDLAAALVEPQLGQLAVDAALAFAAGEVGGADRGREAQVLLDGELFVEGVVLRDVGDVLEEGVEIPVEGALVELDLPGDRGELAGQGPQQSALAASARPHDADHLAPLDVEGEAVQGVVAAAEPADKIPDLQRADDVSLLLDDPVGEVAAEHLTGIDPDRVAILQVHRSADGLVAHDDGTVGLEHLDPALFQLIVAGDAERDLTPDAGGDEDVVVVETAGVVRGDVLGLGTLQLEPSPEGPDPALEVLEIEFAPVTEEDLIGELGLDDRTLGKRGPPEGCPEILQGRDGHLEAEGDLQVAVTAPRLLQANLLVVDRDEDVRKGDVPLGVEVEE